MRKSTFLVCMLMLVFLSACANRPATVHCITQEDFCIGLVTDVGKIDDQALNQITWEGLKRAESKLDVHVEYIETIDSRDYGKNINTFVTASYDLIVTVGYNQREATLAAARKYPEVNFVGVDQPLEHDKSLPPNLIGLAYQEDQLGFLAGVLATQMTKVNKVGAVCGPDFLSPAWRYCEGFKAGVNYINFPPTPLPEDTGTPTPTPTLGTPAASEPEETPIEGEPAQSTPAIPSTRTSTPLPPDFHQGYSTRKQFALKAKQETTPEPSETTDPGLAPEAPPSNGEPTLEPVVTEEPTPPPIVIEAIVAYHNDIGFKDSVIDPKWDAEAATKLIDDGVDVIFGADSYGIENGAVSAAAKRFKYAIGVNTDQYFVIPEARNMLVSSVIKQVDVNLFELIKIIRQGNFQGGNFIGTVGYAPHHDVSDRVPAGIRARLSEIQKGVANGSIEIDVLWRKP